MFENALKYVTVAAVVLLVPIAWLIVREILAEAPIDVDQALFHNEVKARCVERHPCQVTIPSLLANPISFDGSFVRISGVLRIEFEGEYLYATREDYDDRNWSDAIWLNLSREQYGLSHLNGKNAEILGKISVHPRNVETTIKVIEIQASGS